MTEKGIEYFCARICVKDLTIDQLIAELQKVKSNKDLDRYTSHRLEIERGDEYITLFVSL